MFDIGANALAYPDAVRAQVAAGMWVGNHTADHVDLTRLGTRALRDQIAGGQTAVRDITGRAPTLLRPPFLATDRAVRLQARRQGLVEVLATVDSRDYLGASAREIAAAAGRLEPGGIFLMHEWPAASIRAIPRIARVLERKGLCAGRIRATRRDIHSPGGETIFHAVAVRP